MEFDNEIDILRQILITLLAELGGCSTVKELGNIYWEKLGRPIDLQVNNTKNSD